MAEGSCFDPDRDKNSVLLEKYNPAMTVWIWKNLTVGVPELLCIYISFIESKICFIIFLVRKTITGNDKHKNKCICWSKPRFSVPGGPVQ